MKKKEFWDYSGVRKAPGPPLGSRLVHGLGHVLLVSGCLASFSTVIISLCFYFFPDQSAAMAHSAYITAQTTVQNILHPPEKPHPGDPFTRKQKQSEDHFHQNAFSTSKLQSMKGRHTSRTLLALANARKVREIISSQVDAQYQLLIETAMGPMLYYNQGDSHWADHLYGGRDPMRDYGCGPTVTAMLINAFSDQPITPDEMADWCAQNGSHASGSGSYHSIIPKTLSAFGLQVDSVAGIDAEEAAGLLGSGHVLVALMGKGAFSNGGHFIIIAGLLEDGKVSVADSNNFENTLTEWDLEQILRELKHSSDGGAPLWAVSYPETAVSE
ncbi:MAG: C39 family peptidase [Lachnospiraceae bacterium]|jgi:hypothetical protein|nr:C39 family peptidase [Lachnospiraceae bacterium]